jgi:hypothetical protein
MRVKSRRILLYEYNKHLVPFLFTFSDTHILTAPFLFRAQILMTCGAKTTTRNHAGRLASEEARARGRTEVAAAIMTFKTDVVVVRTRLDNLMNRTDADYRKHRQRVHIQRGGPASGGGIDGGAVVSTAGGAGTGAGGGSIVSGEGGDTFAPSGTDAVPTSRQPSAASGAPLRLPPIQPRGAPLALPGGVAAERQENTAALRTGAQGENVGSPRISTAAVPPSTTDPPLTLPVVSENATPAERAKAQAASEAREREVYERRMSTIVAAADPWNLAPHTKPRPNKLAAMSFYKKPNNASSGAK